MRKINQYFLVLFLLIIMFSGALLSVINESFTFDETAHIGAGYSYLVKQDYRLNPEHPPLIKNIAALPLLFLDLNFPEEHSSWQEGNPAQWWAQFDFANQFIYHSGNNPQAILIWSKLPIIIILILLGLLIFIFAKKFFGLKVAFLSLIFFVFSPTFIAHGRLITTDVGACLGFLLAIYFWLKFLEKPKKKNIILAGLVFGLALLIKFSLILLIPFFLIITPLYIFLFRKPFWQYIGFSFLVGLIGLVFVIWPIYAFNTAHYPAERQLNDTLAVLESNPMGALKSLDIAMVKAPVLRPLGHYLLGLLMATHRTTTGNSVYLMGMLSGTGWWFYFPLIYLLKVPLAFHILTLIVIIFILSRLVKNKIYSDFLIKAKEWLKNNFPVLAMIIFLVIYWFVSMSGKLNIGIRHILPTFPFIYILVSLGIVRMISYTRKRVWKRLIIIVLGILLGWYIFSSINVFPYYLSYYNELAGGTDNGYKYAVDSNYDWGQDMKRLKDWLTKESDKRNIDYLKIDYFGGGDAEYYFGNKYQSFDPKEGPAKGWIAISVNQLQAGLGKPVSKEEFSGETGYYEWIKKYQPVARAGKSIFIYEIR
jgi:hypothetical protein